MKKMSTKSLENMLAILYGIILERKRTLPHNSYVASLMVEGKKRIHGKILEEAHEVVEASEQASREEIIHEVADLWFHTLVLLGYWEVNPEEISRELQKRRARLKQGKKQCQNQA